MLNRLKKQNDRGIKKKQSPSIDEQKEQEKALSAALLDYVSNHTEKKNKRLKNIKALEQLLTQYMNSFILIGYTQDTQEMLSIVNAKSEQTADSLSAALNKFIINGGGKKPPSSNFL